MSELQPEPARIRLECNACGYVWVVVEPRPALWWRNGDRAPKLPPACWCPKCSATPPIVVDHL